MDESGVQVSTGKGIQLCVWFIFSAFIFVQDIEASTLEEAEASYAEGFYLEAAQIAEEAGGASGFAFAATSLNIYALYYAEKEESVKLYQRAMDLAGRAVEIDPKSLRGNNELARAMGRYSQRIGRVRAMNEKFAERIRKHIEVTLSIDDQFAEGHLALGRWHAGLIEVLGSFLARSFFGASKNDAVYHLERALELDSEGIDSHYGVAIGFLALGKRKYRKKAKGLLLQVAKLPVRHVYQVVIQEKAIKRIEKLNVPQVTNHEHQNK